MKKDDNCIFCKIVEGKIPAAKIYDNDTVFAFLDIHPVNKGHTLVCPKAHSRNMLEDDDKDLAACIHTIKMVAKGVMKATGATGFNLISNINPSAGQAVFHTHFHIIPRFDDDGLRHWPQKKYTENEIDDLKELIKITLNNLV